jgi:hypothetical protein
MSTHSKTAQNMRIVLGFGQILIGPIASRIRQQLALKVTLRASRISLLNETLALVVNDF